KRSAEEIEAAPGSFVPQLLSCLTQIIPVQISSLMVKRSLGGPARLWSLMSSASTVSSSPLLELEWSRSCPSSEQAATSTVAEISWGLTSVELGKDGFLRQKR
ncbi:hypothetical protein MUK42_34963, partial [Musa troglodytarum]